MWSELLEDDEALRTYSIAMHSLATGRWVAAGHEASRITWCVEVCRGYFGKGCGLGCGLQKQLLKDLRRVAHKMMPLVTSDLLPKTEAGVMSLVKHVRRRPWRLLDVGSCYNPFSCYEEFSVTAVDIAPAHEASRSGGVVMLWILYCFCIISLVVVVFFGGGGGGGGGW